MATHPLNNGIPVGMENRHLLYERHYYKPDCEDKKHGKTKHHSKYHHKTKNHHEDSYKTKKPDKTKCPTKKKRPPEGKKPYKEKKPPKAKNPPYKVKPKKSKNPPEYKDPPDVDGPYNPGDNNPDDPYNPGGNNPDDPYNPGGNNSSDPYNPGGNNSSDPYNPGGNNPSDPYNPGGNNPGPYNPGGNNPGGNNPGGLDGPPDNNNPSGSNPSENVATSSVYQTSTAMPNALPSGQNRTTLSVGGILLVTVILVGVIALVAFVVYRKRSSLRKGAVRLEDYDDGDSVEPRFLSMSNIRSLRVPSIPPRVQLARLSSATILLPFRNSTLNNNLNNNGYLSPNTINHNLSRPLSPGLLTPDDYNDYSQKTDSVQTVQSHPSSHESYTSLESSFPVPPQRIDRSDSTPTSATFGDIYNLKII